MAPPHPGKTPPPPPSSLPPSLSPPCKAQSTIICLQTMSRTFAVGNLKSSANCNMWVPRPDMESINCKTLITDQDQNRQAEHDFHKIRKASLKLEAIKCKTSNLTKSESVQPV